MPLHTLAFGIILGAGAALVTSQAVSQDTMPKSPAQTEPAATPQPTPDQVQQQMLEAWKQLTSPGPQHALLAKWAGEWDTTTEMFWNGPGSDAIVTHGTSTRTMVLGGRFLKQEETSTMKMPTPGSDELTEVPWNGVGMFGFDNYRNMYTGVWMDSMGTQMLTMKGMADPTGHVVTYFGDMDEPMMGVIGRTVKYVTTVIDENTQTFEVYDLHAGDDYMVMRVTYKRKK